MIHSDHGTQFTPWAFTRRALDSGLVHSIRSIGDCSGKGQMDSFWGRLQVELLNRKRRNIRLELATPSSNTLRPSTTDNDATRRSGCSARSNASDAMPTTQPAIQQAERAIPGAHESLQPSRWASESDAEIAWWTNDQTDDLRQHGLIRHGRKLPIAFQDRDSHESFSTRHHGRGCSDHD